MKYAVMGLLVTMFMAGNSFADQDADALRIQVKNLCAGENQESPSNACREKIQSCKDDPSQGRCNSAQQSSDDSSNQSTGGGKAPCRGDSCGE